MRLITRSDFDGLICALLLKQVEQIDEIKFVHPKDLQAGAIDVTENDILANVPFVEGCGLWFNHHPSDIARVADSLAFRGDCRNALSASRVVYDYYGGKSTFGDINEMMSGVDKADSAQFDIADILDPKGWVLLSFLMDARTGLGRYHDYRISNYQLMYELIDACATRSIHEILQMPDVRERVTRYYLQDVEFRNLLRKRTRIQGSVIVTDMRDIDPIPCGNRFMAYALWPRQNSSIWIVNGFRNQNCVFACGHSIINRTAQTDIGKLMAEFSGHGHRFAGSCQVPHSQASATVRELIARMNTDGVTVEAIPPLLKAA